MWTRGNSGLYEHTFISRTPRRPDQRRQGRRRLQLPPHPQVVEVGLVHNHHRNIRHDNPILNAQTGFLTTDQLVELRNGSSATAQEDAFAIANQFSRRRSPEKQ